MIVTARHLADHVSIRRAVDQGSLGKESEARTGIINGTRVNIERRKRVNVLVVRSSFPSSSVARRRKAAKGVLSLVKR